MDISNAGDRKFVVWLIVAVLVTWGGMLLYGSHLKATRAQEVASAAKAPKRVMHLEAIPHVYECQRDGQRILSDRPCGTGVPIRVLDIERKGD